MWSTIGHERAVALLKRGLEQGRASHAYLIVGPPRVGKMTLAIDLARALNCVREERPCGECEQCLRISRGVHADVKVVERGAGGESNGQVRVSIGIDQVREAIKEASLKPFEGSFRVFVFDGAEHLTDEGSNSLLKTLEEPPSQVVFVLLAVSAEILLPTIVSRCQLLELRALPRELISRELQSRFGLDEEAAREIGRLSAGSLGWAIEASTNAEVLEALNGKLDTIEEVARGDLEARFGYAMSLARSFARDRDAVARELRLWVQWWRDMLLQKEGLPDRVTNSSRVEALRSMAEPLSVGQIASAATAVLASIEHLERNVNPRLALEDLMLNLPRVGG